MAGKASAVCGECRFPNLPGSTSCLQCKAPILDDAQEILGYLCCDPFEAKVLRPGVEYRLGRSKSCEFHLPHKTLSRVHGIVRVDGDTIVFRDESSNGSTLNGRRVKGGSVLEVGDVLSLGPYEVEIRATPNLNDSEVGGGTVALDFTSRITGHIEDEPLMQALQGMEFHNRSGTLEVVSGRIRGYLVLKQGRPLGAKLGDLEDDEAVYSMLALTEGQFVFTPELNPDCPARMTRPVTALLLEFARRSDEIKEDEDPPTVVI